MYINKEHTIVEHIHGLISIVCDLTVLENSATACMQAEDTWIITLGMGLSFTIICSNIFSSMCSSYIYTLKDMLVHQPPADVK